MHISLVQRTGSEAGTSAQALGAHQNFLGGCPRSKMSYMVPLMSHNIPQCVQNVHNEAFHMPVHTLQSERDSEDYLQVEFVSVNSQSEKIPLFLPIFPLLDLYFFMFTYGC